MLAAAAAAVGSPEVQALALSTGSVRVHGRVLRAGVPVPHWDLSFLTLAETGRGGEAEWDFSDRAGRYEVVLSAGRYAVHHGETGQWLTDVLIPGGARELALDLELSAATDGPR